MDIKTEIKIEEEDLELPSECPHQNTHIPPDTIIYLKPPAQGEDDEVIRPETASRDTESSDFIEDYGNLGKGVGNVDHQRKVVVKRSRKDGSEQLGNFKLEHTVSNSHFKNKIMFENHSLLHRKKKLLKCSWCSFQCDKKFSLKRHIFITHTKRNLFKSSEYNLACNQEANLKSHFKFLKCSECRYECRSESYLKRHYLTHRKKNETEWVWSYKENEYLMECYFIGEAILAKTEKMELGNYVKEEKIKPNDFMEYMFKLKYSNLDRKTLVKQKHRILFNVIKERQEYKKKVHFPSEDEIERIKAKAIHFVENEFEPSRKLITKIKENVHKLNKKKKKIAKD